jgi:hypothetical protein
VIITNCFSFRTCSCRFSISCTAIVQVVGGGCRHTRKLKQGLQAPVSMQILEVGGVIKMLCLPNTELPIFRVISADIIKRVPTDCTKTVTLLRVTAFVWNVLQSATTADIITPPQRRQTDWQAYAVTVCSRLLHYDYARSKPRSCRSYMPHTAKRKVRVCVFQEQWHRGCLITATLQHFPQNVRDTSFPRNSG